MEFFHGDRAHMRPGPSYGGGYGGGSGSNGVPTGVKNPLQGLVPRQVTIDQAKSIMVSRRRSSLLILPTSLAATQKKTE